MEQLPTTDQRRNSTLHDPTSDGSGQFKREKKEKEKREGVGCHRSEINTNKAHERLKEPVLLLPLVLSSIYRTTQRADTQCLRETNNRKPSDFCHVYNCLLAN